MITSWSAGVAVTTST